MGTKGNVGITQSQPRSGWYHCRFIGDDGDDGDDDDNCNYNVDRDHRIYDNDDVDVDNVDDSHRRVYDEK